MLNPQALIDHIPYCIFWKDKQGKFLGANKRFISHTEFKDISEVIGKTDYDMPWKKYASIYQDDDTRIINSKISKINHEEPHRDSAGEEFVVKISKVPLIDKANNVYGILGIYFDAEEKNKSATSLLNDVISYIPHHIFWKDTQGKFLGCNQLFSEVAGLNDPLEIIGKTDFDMPWYEQAEKYSKDDQTVMKSKKPRLDIEDLQKRQDGSEIVALVSKVPLFDPIGKVYGILGIYSDITERKKIGSIKNRVGNQI